MFKFLGAQVAQRRMGSFSVIPYFHVLKDVLPGLLMALIVVVIDPLLLEGGKETLHDGVIVAVAFSAHGTGDLIVSE